MDAETFDMIRSINLSNGKKANPKKISKGEKLCAELLKKIRADDYEPNQAVTIDRAGFFSFASTSEPLCVLIYQKGRNWWGDIVFVDVEAGNLNCVGVPAALPQSSRGAAIEYTENVLHAWVQIKKDPPGNDDNTIMIDGKRTKIIAC